MFIKIARIITFLFHRHKWVYRVGNSNGVISGLPRKNNFIRECTECCKRQEVNRFTDVYKSPRDGMKFFTQPEWITYKPDPENRNGRRKKGAV